MSHRLFNDISDVYHPMVMILFAWALTTICVCMLMIQMEIVNFDFSSIFFLSQFSLSIFLLLFPWQNFNHYFTQLMLLLIYETFVSFALLFLFCELGERVGNGFNGISNMFDEFDWHLLSIENQKNLPTILAMAHIEMQFCCFGSICCVRETFEKVWSSWIGSSVQFSHIFLFWIIFSSFSDCQFSIFLFYDTP